LRGRLSTYANTPKACRALLARSNTVSGRRVYFTNAERVLVLPFAYLVLLMRLRVAILELREGYESIRRIDAETATEAGFAAQRSK
jgi:hypothetical protein